MNEELQKRISAALDAASDAPASSAAARERDLASLIAQSPEAAAYARDLERLGRALRDWPLPDPGDDAMEALALRIEQRLDEDLPRIADPTLPPTFDDDDELRDATSGLLGGGLLGGAGVSSGEFELVERMSLVPDEAPRAPAGAAKPASVPPPPPPAKAAPKAPEPPAVRAIPKLATAAEIKKQNHDPDRISFPSISPASSPSIGTVTPITPKKERRPMGWVAGLAAAAAVGLGIVATTSMYSGGAIPSPSSLASPAEPQAHGGMAADGRAAEEAAPAVAAAELPASPASVAPPLPTSPAVTAPADMAWEGARARPAEPRAQAAESGALHAPGAAAMGPGGVRGGASAGGGGAAVDALLDQSARDERAPMRRAREAPSAAPAPAPRTATSSGALAPATGTAAPDPEAPAETRAAVARAPAVPEAEEAAPEDLPALPERGEVLSSLQRVEPTVRACAAEEHGTATVRIVVASSGRVTTATVSGPFAGTPVGSCVARAVRTARFPRFSSERFEITYPFTL